jgi:hypothetical protein
MKGSANIHVIYGSAANMAKGYKQLRALPLRVCLGVLHAASSYPGRMA